MTDTGSLRDELNPRPLAKKNFSLSEWNAVRDAGIAPLHVSDYMEIEAGRAEYLVGVEAMGLPDVLPQSLTVVDVLNRNDETTVICIPRRASKTTTVLTTLLGRMMTREDYQVAFTAQTGDKARKRLISDVINRLARKWDRFDDTSPFTWGVSNSNTYVHVKATGSRITAVPPSEDAARGDAYSAFVIDEMQEVDQELWDSLAGAIYPTFDTVPGGGQLFALGTAGEARAGGLWNLLEQGRKGDVAIVEYAAPDGTPLPDLDDPDEDPEGTTADEAVWLRAHPGIGNLTSLETVRRRSKLPPEQFAREYLGVWPNGAGSRLIPSDAWEACRLRDVPSLPDQWVLAYATDPDDLYSALVAFWRDANGLGHFGVLKDGPGSRWVEAELRGIYAKHRKPVVYDSSVPIVKNVIDSLQASGRVRVNPQRFFSVASAAVLLVREVKARRVRHYSQPVMDTGAAHAIKRKAVDRWVFGSDDRGNSAATIVALEAAAMAMRAWDEKPPKARRSIGAVAE